MGSNSGHSLTHTNPSVKLIRDQATCTSSQSIFCMSMHVLFTAANSSLCWEGGWHLECFFVAFTFSSYSIWLRCMKWQSVTGVKGQWSFTTLSSLRLNGEFLRCLLQQEQFPKRKKHSSLFSPPWGGPEELRSKLVRTNAVNMPGGVSDTTASSFNLRRIPQWSLHQLPWDGFWNSPLKLHGATLTLMLIQEEACLPATRRTAILWPCGRTHGCSVRLRNEIRGPVLLPH